MAPQTRPLDGPCVIDYPHVLAGPHVSRCLAAPGAPVIRVERPGGGDAGRRPPAHSVLGGVRLANLPFRFAGCDTAPTSPAPLPGRHNRDIAAELGCSADDVAALERDGVRCAGRAATVANAAGRPS